MLDFSDYPEDSRFYDPVNKKLIGEMKDEVGGKIINEFVGWKSKMYSLVTIDDKEIKKAKGANKNIVHNIKHKKYGDALFGKRRIVVW